MGQWIIKAQKTKKISSIPWAHRIRLSAHAICITLGTADITSSHGDFQFIISSILNVFEDVLGRQNLDLVQPFLQCSQATHSSRAYAKSYPQEEYKIPTLPRPSSYHFYARISAHLVTFTGLHFNSSSIPFRTHRVLLTNNTHFGMKRQVYTPYMKSMLNSFFVYWLQLLLFATVSDKQ